MSKKDLVSAEKKFNKDKKSGFTKKKKTAAAIIIAGALALIAFLFMVYIFDLGPVKEIKSTEEQARVVGECAGFEVRYEELRYITLIYRDELDSEYGEYSSLSQDEKLEYESELQKRINEEICENYAILSLCDEYGIDTASKEAKRYVRDAISELVGEIGGKKEYASWLDENRLTDAFLRLIYKLEYLEGVLLEEISKDSTVVKYSELNLDEFVDFIMQDDSYIKVIHAFYPKQHDYLDTSEMNARAKAALSDIIGASTDSDRLKRMQTAIGRAPFVQGYSVTGTDYYITYGQMNEKYEETAYALSELAVSDVVELDEGYYIIMRVPKVRDEVAPRAYEFIGQYRYAVLKQLCDKRAEELSFSGNEYFKGLELAEIK